MSWAAIPRFKHWTPVVYTSLDAEADIFQGKLAAEGIPAVVFPRCAYPSAYGLYYLNEYAVLVPRAQYEKARALLNLEELPEGLDRKDLLSPASDYWFIANLRVLFWPVTLLRMLWAGSDGPVKSLPTNGTRTDRIKFPSRANPMRTSVSISSRSHRCCIIDRVFIVKELPNAYSGSGRRPRNSELSQARPGVRRLRG